MFGPLAPDAVVTDPTAVSELHAPVLVAAGWKPGFSHDFDAVILAERLATPGHAPVVVDDLLRLHADEYQRHRRNTSSMPQHIHKIPLVVWDP